VGYRILVVEDSPVIRRLIQVCLRADSIEIVTREDGPGGLEAVTTESPDLVLLDIGLPGMDGWEVLKAIRSDPDHERLPVIVLTAHAGEDARQQASEAGAAFLPKPFVPKDLRDAVLALIA